MTNKGFRLVLVGNIAYYVHTEKIDSQARTMLVYDTLSMISLATKVEHYLRKKSRNA